MAKIAKHEKVVTYTLELSERELGTIVIGLGSLTGRELFKKGEKQGIKTLMTGIGNGDGAIVHNFYQLLRNEIEGNDK